MKTAIYIEDGVVQLVITPENSFEKDALSSFGDKSFDTRIFEGTFYDCRGGWTRQSAISIPYYSSDSGDKSLILRISEKKEEIVEHVLLEEPINIACEKDEIPGFIKNECEINESLDKYRDHIWVLAEYAIELQKKIKAEKEKCRFSHNLGDINEDGDNKILCLAKSRIDNWPETSNIPCGKLVFCTQCILTNKSRKGELE